MPRWLKRLFVARCKHPGCHVVLPCPDHSVPHREPWDPGGWWRA